MAFEIVCLITLQFFFVIVLLDDKFLRSKGNA